jgi:hypothetical protein
MKHKLTKHIGDPIIKNIILGKKNVRLKLEIHKVNLSVETTFLYHNKEFNMKQK